MFLALDGSIPHDFTFGKSVSWQVVLADLLNDPTRAQRVTQAFLGMQKFDIELRLRA